MSRRASREASPSVLGHAQRQTVGLAVIQEVSHGMGVRLFVLLWSAVFAVFAAIGTPHFRTFLVRCGSIICIVALLERAAAPASAARIRHAYGRLIICAGFAYYLLAVSHSDFLVAVVAALTIAVGCSLFD
jgi:hypothetical protein